jgi:glycosyltransferase involved in cell wall biosynthesis
MKVLHIVSGDLSGGAAKGAYNLHQGLKELGVDSVIFTNSKTTFNDPSVISTSENKLNIIKGAIRNRIERLILKYYPQKKDYLFSTGLFGFNLDKYSIFKDADIINLHWINESFINIKQLKKINKPIVWTLRDMWPMTGGCHYSLDCRKYETNCGECPQLNSTQQKDLSRFIINRKKKYLPKNMRVIGISEWLSQCAAQSSIFNNFEIQTVANCINTDQFRPIDKNIAREVLSIKSRKKIVLIGSINLKDYYKGLSKFIEALNYLDKEKILLCTFGNIEKKLLENTGFEFMNFGFLNDIVSMSVVYSSADVFVAPSIMDAFGKTIVESMACGTPVVCFDATGPKSIVTHKHDGYRARPYHSEDLSRGINWILNSEKYKNNCRQAREKAISKFNHRIVASQYNTIYKDLISTYTY